MRHTLVFSTLFLLLTSAANAHEVAGVELEEQIGIGPSATPLVLNGAGVRSKFFFKIYVGALYLPERAENAASVLAMPGPKRVLMHFLYKEVEAEKLEETWREGFAANTSEAEHAALTERLDRFVAMFRTVKRGDRIRLDYLPDTGTGVWLNDELLGTVPGEDFHRALLRIWLGDAPADKSLKADMLGVASR